MLLILTVQHHNYDANELFFGIIVVRLERVNLLCVIMFVLYNGNVITSVNVCRTNVLLLKYYVIYNYVLYNM